MRKLELLLSLALVATALGIAQDRSRNAAQTADATTSAAVVNPEAQSPAIHILTPVAGQTLTSNFVDLHFELVRPALNDQPNFIIRLDATDPINTTSTSYTFADLQPGVHSLRVTLVDANNSPVPGGTAIVQFKVPATNTPAHTGGPHGAKQHSTRTVVVNSPSLPVPPELRGDGDVNLPLAGSPLPLLSIIGFGLLIGGAAHTMRSR